MKYSVLVIIILTLMSCQPKHDLPVTINLHNDWQFKAVTDSMWQ
ncbi:MAG: beta-mannosidase, partial [Glaciecola sp.]